MNTEFLFAVNVLVILFLWVVAIVVVAYRVAQRNGGCRGSTWVVVVDAACDTWLINWGLVVVSAAIWLAGWALTVILG